MLTRLIWLVLLLTTTMASDCVYYPPIKLSDTVYLDFAANNLTSGEKPVQQLQCHGSGCALWKPEFVTCTNVNYRQTPTIWQCQFIDVPEWVTKLNNNDRVECEAVFLANGEQLNTNVVRQDSCSLHYQLDINYRNENLWFAIMLAALIVYLVSYLCIFRTCPRWIEECGEKKDTVYCCYCPSYGVGRRNITSFASTSTR